MVFTASSPTTTISTNNIQLYLNGTNVSASLVFSGGPSTWNVSYTGMTGPVTAGFLPSADLTFSPVARSTDGGRSWSPGALPTALVRVPDALTVSTSGRLLALVGEEGQTVLSSPGGLSRWRWT